MIVYVSFEVRLHELALGTAEQIEELRQKLDTVVRDQLYPSSVMLGNTDVEVSVIEHAGTPD
jgi:hypothetical protein